MYTHIHSVFSPGYHFSSLYYSLCFLLLFLPFFLFCCTGPRLGWNSCLSLLGLLADACSLLKVLDLLKLLHIINPAPRCRNVFLFSRLLCHTVHRSASVKHMLVGLFSSLRAEPLERKGLNLVSICLCFLRTKSPVHIGIS